LCLFAIAAASMAAVTLGHPVYARPAPQSAPGLSGSGFRRIPGGFQSVGHNGNMIIRLTATGLLVSAPPAAGGWSVGLNPSHFGRTTLSTVKRAVPVLRGQRVQYRYPTFTLWYNNPASGLEQGITIPKRPAGSGRSPVIMAFHIKGGLTVTSPGHGNQVRFSTEGRTVLAYLGMTVTDARGRHIPATLRADSHALRIQIPDRAARYPLTVDPFFFFQQLTDPSGTPKDYFGCNVAMSSDGNVVAVSSWNNNYSAFPDPNTDAKVYIFARNGAGYTSIGQVSVPAYCPSLALSSDGSTLLVGAIKPNIFTGAAYIFSRGADGYAQTSELTASDGQSGDNFGISVALSGDGSTALIGAYGHVASGQTGRGAAYVFNRDGMTYHQAQELIAPDSGSSDQFGFSLALSTDGDVALIGSYLHPDETDFGPGAAYVFTRDGSTYTQTQELTASDPTNTNGAPALFGSSLALSADGSVALIGSQDHTVNGMIASGSAYVFDRTSSVSGSPYTQTAELNASDASAEALFGSFVQLNAVGSEALIGSLGYYGNSGADYIFSQQGSSWSQAHEQAASGDFFSGQFGNSGALSADGTVALLGADENNGGDGAAYIFTPTDTDATMTLLAVTGGSAPPTYGDSLTFTASVWPPSTPTGSVTFWDGDPSNPSSIALGTAPLSDGQASASTGGLHAGDHQIFAVYSGDGTDAPSQDSVTETIDPTPLAIAAGDQTAAIGSPLPLLTFTAFGFVNGDTLASLSSPPTCSAAATTDASGNITSAPGAYSIFCSGAVDGDYAITYSPGTLTVNPAPLSIRADAQSAVVGSPQPSLTFTISGFVNGDTLASLSVPPTCTTTAATDGSGNITSPAGTYPITCSGAVDDHYAITYSPGTLTITAT
jgi:MBG domain (YGX type)/Bacterial Ig-like domain (group 3)/FG-GAP repeat